MEEEKSDLLLFFSPLIIPVLQTGILFLSVALNEEYYSQFDESIPLLGGIGQGGPMAENIFAQCLIAIALGFMTSAFSRFRPAIRRILHLIQGTLGAIIFGWCLAKYWNFEADYSSPSSHIVFDFNMCILFGLPFLWCLGLILFVAVIRAPTKQLPSH